MSNVQKTSFLCIALLLVSASGTAVNLDDELTTYQDKGAVEGELTVTAPDGYVIHSTAYVAQPPFSEDRLSTEWQAVNLNANTQAPNTIWDVQIQDGDTPRFFKESGTVDVSQLSEGKYALFLWGCDTASDTPECEWLEPYAFQVPASQDTQDIKNTCQSAQNLRARYIGDTYKYNPGGDTDWIRNGEPTELVVEDTDYVAFRLDGSGSIEISSGLSTYTPMDQPYNAPENDFILTQFTTSRSEHDYPVIHETSCGSVTATVTVREMCSNGQSWNGDECTDMFNMVAVPLNYAQRDFDSFFNRTYDDIETWAETMSPLRHDYDNPRKQVKLNVLEPETEYSIVEDGVDTTYSLSNPHTDYCWAPVITDLREAAEIAVRDSPYRNRYDRVMGVHWGKVRITDPNKDLSIDAFGCGIPYEESFIYVGEQYFGESSRLMAHEFGHALDMCHSNGDTVEGENGEDVCDLSETPDTAFHPPIMGCRNDPSLSGEYATMNYCRNGESDRYWGDPALNDESGSEMPYTIVRTWMRHFIEGEEPPGDRSTADRTIETGERVAGAVEDAMRDAAGSVCETRWLDC